MLTLRLREVRLKRQMPLRALEAQSGIPFANISRYETGAKQPTLDTLAKLAKALGVSVCNLIEE